MGKIVKREILIDYTDSGSPRVIQAKIGRKKYKLKGKCNNCGKCCSEMDDNKGCKHLVKEGGSFICGLGWLIPFGCRLYPLPGDEIEGCGFYWK